MKKAFTFVGVTHVDVLPPVIKFGFTLSELLITIGIIGVVAAIVIPVITNNVQDRQHAAMWKKKYSEIVNIYREVKDEFGGDICVESKTGYVKSAKYSRIGDFAKYTTLSPDFVNEFISRLKVVDSCGKPEYGESKLCKNYDFKWVGYCHPSAYGYYGSLVQGRGKAVQQDRHLVSLQAVYIPPGI